MDVPRKIKFPDFDFSSLVRDLSKRNFHRVYLLHSVSENLQRLRSPSPFVLHKEN